MTQEQHDKLATALAKVSPEHLQDALRKGESITIRLTRSDKEEMQATAKSFGLTLTEYLTRLHYLATGKIPARDKSGRGAE